MSGSTTLVTFAVAEEARPFQARLAGHPSIETLLTGIGAEPAHRRLIARLHKPLPHLVISAGFAGGLNPSLQVGDLVYDVSQATHLVDALNRTGAYPARFYCSPRILLTPEAKTRTRHATGADAVEMESAVVQNLCRSHQIPCAVLRAISDPAHATLPIDFNACLSPEGRLRWSAIARRSLRRPHALAGLLHLRSASRTAATRLAQALLHLLEADR